MTNCYIRGKEGAVFHPMYFQGSAAQDTLITVLYMQATWLLESLYCVLLQLFNELSLLKKPQILLDPVFKMTN